MKPNIKVSEIMTRDVEVVHVDDTVQQAAKLMRNARVRNLVVVDKKSVVGIIADKDIIYKIVAFNKNNSTPVGAVMTPDVITVKEEDTVLDAARIMTDKGINALPVVNKDNELVGIVTRTDLLNLYSLFSEYVPLKQRG